MASIATGYEESTQTTGRLVSRALAKFSVPRMLIQLGAVLLGLSMIFQYWSLTLHAPQYPDGLEVTIFTHKVVGDVSEVDGLNHYIGMMPLADAAEFEREIVAPATVIIILLAVVASLLRSRWTALLALGVVLFPIVFAADLYFWLYKAGHDLDPTAALSSSIKPFTPAIVGEGIVGQFSTTANFGLGFWIAIAAAIVAVAGIVGRVRGERSQVAQ
jgi:copper chaperone NosL